MDSGTGTISIGTDATAATYNIATGAGVKVVTLGSTNGASSLALKYGTADCTLASATGTIVTARDTGEISYVLQPAFFARHSVAQSNVSGNGTVVTVNYTTEIFDQNSDYDATNTFTAPRTGRYFFTMTVYLADATGLTSGTGRIVTSNRSYYFCQENPSAMMSALNQLILRGAHLCDMDTADTCIIQMEVSGLGADTFDLTQSNFSSFFSGKLIC